MDEQWLKEACNSDPRGMDVLERVLNLYRWIDLCSPSIDVGQVWEIRC